MTEAGQPLIQIQDLTKVFYTDEIETHASSGIHLSVNKGTTWPCRGLRAAASRPALDHRPARHADCWPLLT
jgi:hypothetical protein